MGIVHDPVSLSHIEICKEHTRRYAGSDAKCFIAFPTVRHILVSEQDLKKLADEFGFLVFA